MQGFLNRRLLPVFWSMICSIRRSTRASRPAVLKYLAVNDMS
jgi:hypothetical protein